MSTGEIALLEVGRTLLLSAVFLVAVIALGERFVRLAVPVVNALDRHNAKLLFPLVLAFFMAWLANAMALAAIVGAFAAGLIVNERHFEKLGKGLSMQELISPLEAVFAPIFFVIIGMQVNLASFLRPEIAALAAAFTVAAIIGKLVSGLPAARDSDRLSVGIGMIPRGEVGLVFAMIGKSMGVVSDEIFAALIVMVMVTTLITPVGLRWSLFREPRVNPGQPGPGEA